MLNGEKHMANMSDPRIPAALAPGRCRHRLLARLSAAPDAQDAQAGGQLHVQFRSSSNYALVPADLATIYNLNPAFSAGFSGQGQTIVVIEDTDMFQRFGLDHVPFELRPFQLHVGLLDDGPPGAAERPQQLHRSRRDPSRMMPKRFWMRNGPAPPHPMRPSSWPSCARHCRHFRRPDRDSEPDQREHATARHHEHQLRRNARPQNGASANAAYNSAYQQAVAEGVSVFVAAGDSGAAGCDANAVGRQPMASASTLSPPPPTMSLWAVPISATPILKTQQYLLELDEYLHLRLRDFLYSGNSLERLLRQRA